MRHGNAAQELLQRPCDVNHSSSHMGRALSQHAAEPQASASLSMRLTRCSMAELD